MHERVLLLTGGSRGIGAQRPAAWRARPVTRSWVNYLSNRAEAEKVVQEINAAGGSAWAVHADVSKSGEILRLFQEVMVWGDWHISQQRRHYCSRFKTGPGQLMPRLLILTT